MAIPIPSFVTNYPQGHLEYLFRKNISKADLRGLEFGGSADSKKPLRDLIDRGVDIIVHTPALITPVQFMNSNTHLRLKMKGWDAIVTSNKLNAGDTIRCWYVYEEDKGILNLIMEKVATEDAGPFGLPDGAGGIVEQQAGDGRSGKAGDGESEKAVEQQGYGPESAAND